MSAMKMGFFLLFLIVFIGTAHYFFYYSVVQFFAIRKKNHRRIVLFSMLSLTGLFIISSTVAKLQGDTYVYILYVISAFWLGLLASLVTASIFVWFFIWMAEKAKMNISYSKLSMIFYSAALLVCAAGLINAVNPQIKNISVTIPELPEVWKGKKVIQLSDVHLGLIYRAKYLKKLVKIVNEQNPDLVVITGDLYDGTHGDLNTLSEPLNKVVSKNGVYFISGNHENYVGLEDAFVALEKVNVKILRNEVVDLFGLKLIGINYPKIGRFEEEAVVLNDLRVEYEGKPNILLYHSPINIRLAESYGVNLQLSGHTHRGQLMPLNLTAEVFYRGFAYGLHKINNYTLYTSSGVGTWGPPIRTSGRSEIVVITLK